MNPRSPMSAVAWEMWARNRVGVMTIGATLFTGAILLPVLGASRGWSGVVNPTGHSLTAVALLMTLACCHFTEGSRKGGFGGFPRRLFHLPVDTRSLVALPMIHGAAAMVLVYLLCAGLILRHIESDPPLLRPCLYLVFGLSQFQMILWSLPRSRYLKLLCLSVMASIITFGWMFFTPAIVAGALSEWGYAGDPSVFMRRVLVALALAGPVAYVISWVRVHQQRHGRAMRSFAPSEWWDRSVGLALRRRAPFRSAGHAIFWREWLRTGFVLPVVVVVIIALTCVPAWLSGGLSGSATTGILSWLFVSPFLLAVVIGRGFSKPDFWSDNLKVAPFHAIRPVTSGQWVMVKLNVALVSAALTWSLVICLSFVWTAHVGDLDGPEVWLARLRFFYSSQERWLMLVFAPLTAVIVTWRFLVTGLASGLSGAKARHGALNVLTGIGLVALFILTIWRGDHENHSLHLYNLWPVIASLPGVLTGAVIVKMICAAIAWGHALRHELISQRAALCYFAGWLLMVAVVAMFFFILVRNTLWLRHMLMLLAVLLIPLAGPAFAMRSLAANRSNA